MDELLQQFEAPIADKNGVLYTTYLYGRSRPGDTWQGWLVFERQSDGRRFSTGVETTQPDAQAILYWATGLTAAYFDGALDRARKTPRERHDRAATQEATLAEIEHDVLACFRFHRAVRIETRQLLDELPYAHAATTRALEDLEKQGSLLVRRTENGTDWIYLTEAGVDAANVERVAHTHATVERELPKAARRP